MIQAAELIHFIRKLYDRENGSVPLHAPVFIGDEKKYLEACIDSTFVSTVGRYVTELEENICLLTGAGFAVATVNGTSALHAVLLGLGVRSGEEVLTQPFSFVATTNAIRYCGADPVFLDVDEETLGLDSKSVRNFLRKESVVRGGFCYNRRSGKKISACVPMHTFGHPCHVQKIVDICSEYSIPVVEDAAEALGSIRGGKYCGTFGRAGIFSFNGNKIVTCGGGGAIVTDDEQLALRLRFLTTTAKKDHPWLYEHSEVGYNYRMPNINAALGCAQLRKLETFLRDKRTVAEQYKEFFIEYEEQGYLFISEPEDCRSNYWLNAILVPDREERDLILEKCNEAGVMVRPVWSLLSGLPMYKNCQRDSLATAAYLEERLVNLPSGVRP